MDQYDHLSEALSIRYDSDKIRILIMDSVSDRRLGIKLMPELRYLKIFFFESSISRLQNLEFLRVEIVNCKIPPYILNMPKLRHLHVGNSFFPAAFSEKCDTSQINSLQTLRHIDSSDSKDEEILRCSPNLRTLKCRCKFSGKCFPNLNFLSQLESLTVVGSRISSYSSMANLPGNIRISSYSSMANLPGNIKKLTLSRIGMRWEDMSIIGTLPNLAILKLECRAFEGENWVTNDDEFQKLKFLKLREIQGLKQWNSSYEHFPVLERLVLEFCKDLEMIPFEFSNILTLQKIEIYRCHKNVEKSALEICEEQRDCGNQELVVTIDSLRLLRKNWRT
ncbi:Hypothetical predicted protein [Olea europaea subsp. europaea]|uniref:Disease resistance R13L4/SHOC-2-like LRR domain-containing protein n=1 Tax=Olea europaea subsp. europaea TaxID=158383 RepID=A0A8S0RP58_OLEEU|nr:Hypothetical predicted protein [Olea europaea subsp. europaea]